MRGTGNGESAHVFRATKHLYLLFVAMLCIVPGNADDRNDRLSQQIARS
jgi:hypothetical protein